LKFTASASLFADGCFTMAEGDCESRMPKKQDGRNVTVCRIHEQQAAAGVHRIPIVSRWTLD
jgi:hypothetical protein